MRYGEVTSKSQGHPAKRRCQSRGQVSIEANRASHSLTHCCRILAIRGFFAMCRRSADAGLNKSATRFSARPYCPKSCISSTLELQRALQLSDIGVPARRLNLCVPRHSYFPGDTRHFPIREWLCLGADLKPRRILSCLLQEQKACILRGNLGIVGCNLQISEDLRLYGGPGRDRTDDLFHAIGFRIVDSTTYNGVRELPNARKYL